MGSPGAMARSALMTDLRPSRNGDGDCAGCRIVFERLGERWRNGAVSLPILSRPSGIPFSSTLT